MWWQPKQPLTDAERRQEIRRLEAVREKLLNEAPKHFYFRRLLLPIMMAMVAYVIVYTAWRHPLQLTPLAVIFLAAFCFIIGHSTWRVWHKTPALGDRWGFSHEAPNLGILGASVMGTSGARNPTLTVQALAWRTAEHLIEKWKTIAG